MFLLAILPTAAGIVLGTQLVARELDSRSAPFTWSVAPRRSLWLAEHVALDGAVVAAFGVIVGLLGVGIIRSQNPGLDLTATFLGYGLWGPLPLARGIASLAIGTLVGTLVGRAPTSLLVGALVAPIAIAAVMLSARIAYPNDVAVWSPERHSTATVLYTETGKLLAPDGRLVELSEALTHAPPGLWESDPDSAEVWLQEHYPAAIRFIPGTSALAVSGLEALTLLGVASFSALAASAILGRRRLA